MLNQQMEYSLKKLMRLLTNMPPMKKNADNQSFRTPKYRVRIIQISMALLVMLTDSAPPTKMFTIMNQKRNIGL